MADNVQRSKGRGQGYKFDRGGMPAEFGPFIGLVKNNVDPTRSGRLQVYIEQFSGGNEEDSSLWRTVSYLPPFYGTTNPPPGPGEGAGGFTVNQQSYGMWFTPPDINTQVMCFFVAGDPNQGFYIGCVPDPAVHHMVPAIGASTKFQLDNNNQAGYFSKAKQLPVTEINIDNEAVVENPRFFDETKPVHSYLAGIMMQQGIINDTVRGPITSNSQRESPSTVYGISTPGKPIYQGGLSEQDIRNRLERSEVNPQDIKVIARRGGHSLVMDDGNLDGRDNLVRIRTSKGHQITMSDDGDCFYVIHANGQTWLEFGKQGTVDVFSTNSVNIRTQGTINLHADKDINMFAGGAINMKSTTAKLESLSTFDILGAATTLYSKQLIGIKSDGSVAIKSANGSWDGGNGLNFVAGCINLNGGGAQPVQTPASLKDYSLADTTFVNNQGWTVEPGKLKTIVTRAPTHEPYPYHNEGVSATTILGTSSSTSLVGSASQLISGLTNTVVNNGISSSDFLKTISAEIPVGSLSTTQVTGLLAQTINDVGQSFNTISADKGIGQFGFSASQLESAGFLKPGTVSTFLQDPNNLTQVLSSPSVWTGKNGVGSLGTLLNNPTVQSITQNTIMVSALDGLKSAGVISGNEAPKDLAVFVQTASKYGVNSTVEWIKGIAPPEVAETINGVAKNAQYAVNFVDNKASELVAGNRTLGGFTNTTQRGIVDNALKTILGNPKIPAPDFSGGLYSGNTNDELIYEGTDLVVWERINAERLRRGLPGLAAIGYPRPA